MHICICIYIFQLSRGASTLYLLAFPHPTPKWTPVLPQLQHGDAYQVHSGQIDKEPWSLFHRALGISSNA